MTAISLPKNRPLLTLRNMLPPSGLPPFVADKKDGLFAIFAFILGYLFCRWVLVSVQGWGTAVFTAVWLASVLAYLIVRGVPLPTGSWFWFTVTLLTGLSFAFWDDIGIVPLRSIFLFCAAVYWVLSAASALVGGRTSNLLLLDGLNGVAVIPFRNFINQYRALGALRGSKEKGGKKALPVILGIVLAIVALALVTPQLLRADSGGFGRLMQRIVGLFQL